MDIVLSQIKNNKQFGSYLLICQSYDLIQEKINQIIDELNISQVDFFSLGEATRIKIAEIRSLQSFISLRPYSGYYKLAFIRHAELLTIEAANALLKILEEPPARSLIILASPTKAKIISTIVSRCQVIRLNSPLRVSNDKLRIIEDEIDMLTHLNVAQKFAFIDKLIKDVDEEAIVDKLTGWLYFLKSHMIASKKTQNIVKKIQKNQNLLLSTNINKKLLLENLILEL